VVGAGCNGAAVDRTYTARDGDDNHFNQTRRDSHRMHQNDAVANSEYVHERTLDLPPPNIRPLLLLTLYREYLPGSIFSTLCETG
jgi:hypothetical protein